MSYKKFPESESAFISSRRDVMLSYPSYKDLYVDEVETFDIVGESLCDPERVMALSADRPMIASEQRAWDAVSHLHLQYSSGSHVKDIQEFFHQALDYWEKYAAFHVAFHDTTASGGRRVPHLDLHDNDYWRAIRLTSFAILLGHTAVLPRVAALWDYQNEDMDGLLERLVAPFIPGRAAPPDSCTRHLPYFKLLKVFAAEPDKRPALMAKYMDEWYEASRREPYFQSHTKGREHSYLGYWSFEAAAVTYVLDVDDASYRHKDFYPRDLMDFALGLPRPRALGAHPQSPSDDSVRMRAAAGESCPREGYWFSPARIDSRRRFNAGDLMPSLGRGFGSTIWQWDEQQ